MKSKIPISICFFTITSEKNKSVRKSLPKKNLEILLEKTENNKWKIPSFLHTEDLLSISAEKNISEFLFNEKNNFYSEQLKTILHKNLKEFDTNQTTLFLSLVNEENINYENINPEKYSFFNIEEAKSLNFESLHKEIIFGGIYEFTKEEINCYKILQERILYTTLAKEFLPVEFTISNLLNTIQAIVPEFDVKPPNFIRKMVSTKSREGIISQCLDKNDNVKKTNENSQREAKLFKFNNFDPKISIYNSNLK